MGLYSLCSRQRREGYHVVKLGGLKMFAGISLNQNGKFARARLIMHLQSRSTTITQNPRFSLAAMEKDNPYFVLLGTWSNR